MSPACSGSPATLRRSPRAASFARCKPRRNIAWGSDEVSGKTVALQGCGNVGYYLAC